MERLVNVRVPRPHGAGILACLLALLALCAVLPRAASASGNASAAAGFIEGAQNRDGGFGEKRGQASDPTASLWAAAALLAAGRNPGDELVKGGSTLGEYLQSHAAAYRSLSDLGLLAIVQSAAQGSPSYGYPVARLEERLTPSAVHADPAGASLGILGLLAANTTSSHQAASTAAQSLLTSATSDGGWGNEGLSDSASTALVLQALAATGAASANSPVVQSGLAYLKRAQGNDGSIAASIRTDQAIAAGSVTATAFTVQALDSFGLPPIRTATGKSVLEGLTQYQQQGSGGLTSDGSLYSEIPPSVTETAQAFSAFDGITFPLASVPLSAPAPSKSAAKPTSRHVSAGRAAQGVSGANGASADKGAFRQATATSGSSTASRTGRIGDKSRSAPKRTTTGTSTSGTSVAGEVVGTTKPAQLVGVAGQSPGGLTAAEKATLALVALLLGCALLGGFLDARRPRQDGRSVGAVAVAAAAGFLAAARSRGSLEPLAVMLVGLALGAVPFATQMLERAPQGARMVSAFQPFMRPARLSAYQHEVAQLNAGFTQASSDGPTLLDPRASAATARARFDSADPQLAQFEQQWPAVNTTLTGLLGTIQANRGNYDAVAALPSFRLFPWFFIVPGALLIALAVVALVLPGTWRVLRWAAVAVGCGLMLAPVAFRMWERAPQGAAMISAFHAVETRGVVARVQNDFATITTGEGALGGELVPALEARGLSTGAIERALPAVTRLEGSWIQTLQNLTPLIGTMSDNVARYRAVAALPSFRLFPWLFLLAGLSAVAIVVIGAVAPRRLAIRRVQPAGTQAA